MSDHSTVYRQNTTHENALGRYRDVRDLSPSNWHRRRLRLAALAAVAHAIALRRAVQGDADGAARARVRADGYRAQLTPLQERWRGRLREMRAACTPAAIRAWQREMLAATQSAPAMPHPAAPRDRRAEIRQRSGRERRGPPDPDHEAIARQITDALVAPLTRMIATLMAPATDDWQSQRQSPLSPRSHCALGRQLQQQGDPRAAQHGKLWLVRRSAIDEYLAGLPKGTVQRAGLDPIDLLEAELRAEGRLQ